MNYKFKYKYAFFYFIIRLTMFLRLSYFQLIEKCNITTKVIKKIILYVPDCTLKDYEQK